MESAADGANAKPTDEPAFFKSATQVVGARCTFRRAGRFDGLPPDRASQSHGQESSIHGARLLWRRQRCQRDGDDRKGGSQGHSWRSCGHVIDSCSCKCSSTTAVDTAKEKTEGEKQQDTQFFYSCFLMQCLTELLSSYSSCKTSFVNSAKSDCSPRLLVASLRPCRRRLLLCPSSVSFAPGTPGSKGRNPIACWHLGHVLDRARPRLPQLLRQRRATQEDDAVQLGHVGARGARRRRLPSRDAKEVPADLITVRRTMLDAISRSIKEAASSPEPIEVRYGRLYALSDLCYRLLIARPNSTGGKQTEDLTYHMAKTMLEKNFVTVLTSAIADVDLNLPTVKSLLEAILRPLEHLTKVAIRMGKSKDKANGRAVVDESDESEFSSDYGMEEDFDDDDDDEDEEDVERADTPDFYRNSSLGMHTGEMETGLDDDEMSDEDMDDEDDMEMDDFDTETGSELSTGRRARGHGRRRPRVVELTDSDTDMDDSSDEDSDSDEDGHMHSHGHGSHMTTPASSTRRTNGPTRTTKERMTATSTTMTTRRRSTLSLKMARMACLRFPRSSKR